MTTLSRPFLSFALALAVMLAQLSGLSQPPPVLPGVPDSWVPLPGQQGFWQKLPDRMRLTVPPNTEIITFGLRSNEKIDPKAFTIDLWVAQYSDFPSCDFSFDIGISPHLERTKTVVFGDLEIENGNLLSVMIEPSTFVHTYGFYLQNYLGNLVNAKRNIHWIRITYNQAEEHMMIYVNGQSCDWNKGNIRFYGETPLSLLVFPMKTKQEVQQFDIFGINIVNEYMPQPASLPGIAFRGWSNLPLEPNPDCLPGDLADDPRWLSEMPGLTTAGRGTALATQVVVDRVANGNIGLDTWNAILEYLNEDTGTVLSGKSLLLPIAIASGTEGQREQLKTLFPAILSAVMGGRPWLTR